jgi:hypothetical protein
MTIKEGTLDVFFYKVYNQKFDKITPELSKNIEFKYFPYNSRYCNIKKENKIIISGGIDYENMLCSYDYDINKIEELPDMKYPRQMHSMINIDERIYIIGGNHSNKVECFNMHFEDWVIYSDMNYDRRECGLAIVKGENDTFIYAIMGYSNTIGNNAINLERLNIDLDPDESDWQLLPIQNPHFFEDCYITNFGVFTYKKGFLIIGGISNTSSTKNVYYYDIDEFSLERSIYKLPFESSFSEKNMFTYNDNDFYLFTYGTLKLIKFDKKQNCLTEIFQL